MTKIAIKTFGEVIIDKLFGRLIRKSIPCKSIRGEFLFEFIVEKLFGRLIHKSIRDEALGDVWELHYSMLSKKKGLNSYLSSLIQLSFLVRYSFNLRLKNLYKDNIDRAFIWLDTLPNSLRVFACIFTVALLTVVLSNSLFSLYCTNEQRHSMVAENSVNAVTMDYPVSSQADETKTFSSHLNIANNLQIRDEVNSQVIVGNYASQAIGSTNQVVIKGSEDPVIKSRSENRVTAIKSTKLPEQTAKILGGSQSFDIPLPFLDSSIYEGLVITVIVITCRLLEGVREQKRRDTSSK